MYVQGFNPDGGTRRKSHPGTLSAKNLEFTPSFVPANGFTHVVKTLVVVHH